MQGAKKHFDCLSVQVEFTDGEKAMLVIGASSSTGVVMESVVPNELGRKNIYVLTLENQGVIFIAFCMT